MAQGSGLRALLGLRRMSLERRSGGSELRARILYVDAGSRRRHHLAQQRLKVFERHRVISGIEGRLVVFGTELGGVVEVLVPPELLTGVAVETEMVEEEVSLKDPVLLDHPMVLLAHERLHYCRGDVRVVERSERVADVVQESAKHVLVVAPGALGAGGGLQAVFESIDGEAPVVPTQQPEVIQHPIR